MPATKGTVLQICEIDPTRPAVVPDGAISSTWLIHARTEPHRAGPRFSLTASTVQIPEQ